MIVSCTSDFHGYLPKLVPESDLMVIAGDITPVWNHDLHYQLDWLRREFIPWCQNAPAKEIICIAGNHDWIFQEAPLSRSIFNDTKIVYLEDELFYTQGLRIYGSPWSPQFGDWAFMKQERELELVDKQIPSVPQVDILLSHSPPWQAGDLTLDFRNVGSPSLRDNIILKKPKLVVCGHIHLSRGVYELGSSYVVNAASIGEDYKPYTHRFFLAKFNNGEVEEIEGW